MAEVTRRLNVVVAGDAKSVEAAMRKTEQAVKGAADQAERSGKDMGDSFEGVEKKASKLGDKLKGFAASLGAGIGIGGGFAIGEKLGESLLGGFSQALDKGAQVKLSSARLGLSDADAKALGSIAGKLYGNAFVDDYESATRTIEAVVSTLSDDGTLYDPEAMTRLSEKAAVFAKVMDQDVNRAVSSVGILMRTGLVKDADEAFDLITASMQDMPAHMRDELLEASDEYSQFFAALGFEGEQAFGLLAAASRDGMYGIDKTGDALKEFTIRATDLSKSTETAYDAIGLNMGEMTNQILAGGESAQGAFRQIVEGLLGIEDPGRRAEAAIALFGTPLEDLGVNDIPQFLSSLTDMSYSLQDVAGSTDELGKALETPGAKIEKFKRKAMDKLADGFAKVIPLVEKLGPAFSAAGDVIQKVGGWMADNKAVVIGFGVGVAATLIPAFVAWAISAGTAAVATLAAVAPVVAVTVAIGLLVAGIAWVVTHFDIFKNAAGVAFNFVKDVIGSVIDWVGANWPLLLAIITGPIGLAVLAITRNWDTIKSGISGVKDWIGARINEIVGFFAAIPGRITGAFAGLADAIAGPWRTAVGWIKSAWNSTIGGRGISIPDIPGLPGRGKRFEIPRLHTGGVFDPPDGKREGFALLKKDEVVFTPSQAKALGAGLTGNGGGASPTVINVTVDARGAIGLDGSAAERGIAQVVTRAIEHRLIPGLT